MKNFKSKFAANKLTKKEALVITGGKKEQEADCHTSVPVHFWTFCKGKEVVYDGKGCWAGCF